MRKVHMLGVGLIGALVAVACGGSSSSNPPGENGNDGGVTSDGSVVVHGDSGPGASGDGSANGSDDAGVCVIDADLNTLSPVDASLDDAGDSVGTCLGCVKTSCSSQLTACNSDCTCNTEFSCFAECLGGVGNSLISCVGTCFPGGLSAIQNDPVVTCAASSCTDPCGLSGLFGGGGTKDAGGGGTKDSGPATDASTDAAAD